LYAEDIATVNSCSSGLFQPALKSLSVLHALRKLKHSRRSLLHVWSTRRSQCLGCGLWSNASLKACRILSTMSTVNF